MSKGSTPRPIPDRERYSENWDRIQWGNIDESVEARVGEATEAPELEGADAPA